MASANSTSVEQPKKYEVGDSSDTSSAPEGAVCDPVTGVCRIPSRSGGTIPGESEPGLFPLPKTLRPLERLEDEAGKKVDASVFKGKMVGVYASAGWCPPCRVFSPMLSKWAKEHQDDFVVVFLSFDKSEAGMLEFVAGKGFLRMPYKPEEARPSAAKSFGVQVLPTLIIVNGDTGAVITDWGRSAVTKNPKGCLEEWKAGRAGVTWFQLLRPW